MLRRLFMALLIACLAAPAVAAPMACAQPAVTMHHTGHHAPQAPAEVFSHDCIGCITMKLDPAAPTGAALVAKPLLVSPQASFHALIAPAPDTPPPRA